MAVHDFKRLVKKYTAGTTLAIVEEPGHYDMDNGGAWVPGAQKLLILNLAAIVPMNQDDLKFDQGGTYSHDNRKLYCYEKLAKGTVIINCQVNESIREYKVLAEKDYSDYDEGLFIYILERGSRDDKDPA